MPPPSLSFPTKKKKNIAHCLPSSLLQSSCADATNSRKAESLHLRNSKECLKKQKVSKCQSTKISMTFSQQLRGEAILDPSWKKCIKSLTIESIDRLRRNKQDGPNTQLPGRRGHSKTLCLRPSTQSLPKGHPPSLEIHLVMKGTWL